MISMKNLNKMMTAHRNTCAPGSECCMWQDYVGDCHRLLGCSPAEAEAQEVTAPKEMEAHYEPACAVTYRMHWASEDGQSSLDLGTLCYPPTADDIDELWIVLADQGQDQTGTISSELVPCL